MSKEKLKTVCPICGTLFDKWKNGKNINKYCSKECNDKNAKNTRNYWSGKKMTEETKLKMSLAQRGEKSSSWKGDDVGYFGIHTWIVTTFGKAEKCEHCGGIKSKKYHWSNKYHTYKRKREDWQELCSSCHKIYDITVLGCKH